jgi:hypothetical protein
MYEVGEVGLLELRVFSQDVAQEVIELSLLFLFTQKVFDEAFRSVLEIGVEGGIERRQVMWIEL